MKKQALAVLSIPFIIVALTLFTTIAPADYQIVNWARHAFNSNHADSVKTAAGTYRPVAEIIAADTCLNSAKADSVKWGSGYKTLGQFFNDSLALFLRRHGKADSATVATLSRNADSLGGHAPAWYAPISAPTFTGKAEADSMVAKAWIRSGNVKGDTITIPGTSATIYPRDAATVNTTGNWFFNGQIQAYGGIDGVSGTASVTNMKVVSADTGHFVKGVGVGSNDSLKITPEGGIAYLFKNVDTCKLYLGQAATVVGTDSVRRSEAAGASLAFPVYSDSIAAGDFGYLCVSGKALFAITDISTIQVFGALGAGTVRGRFTCESAITNEHSYFGKSMSNQYRRINAHGDSLVVGVIAQFQDAPN